MRGLVRFASIALAVLVLVPAAAYAQASIAGVVKDTSGAVLPGVTVEVASPALIEKTRSTVTDGAGLYQIIAARPGHLYGDVHADRIQHVQARRHRADRVVRRDDQRRHEGRRRGRDHHRHRRDAARGRAERRGAEGRDEGSRRCHSDRPPRHQPRGPSARHHPRRRRRRRRAPTPTPSRRRTSAARRATRFTDLAIHGGKPAEQRQTIGGVSAATTIRFGESLSSSPSFTAMQEMSVNTSGADASMAGGGVQINYVPARRRQHVQGADVLQRARTARCRGRTTRRAPQRPRLYSQSRASTAAASSPSRARSSPCTTSTPATAVRSRRTSSGSS